MGEMTVRKKLMIAYISTVVVFVAAMKLLSVAHVRWVFFGIAAILIGSCLYTYAGRLKCPHCHARAFKRRWLALLYVPRTCASCDREFYD